MAICLRMTPCVATRAGPTVGKIVVRVAKVVVDAVVGAVAVGAAVEVRVRAAHKVRRAVHPATADVTHA